MSSPNLPHASWWEGRRVLVTGHTGFKGGWLSHSLAHLGAELHGLALGPATTPNMFDISQVRKLLASDLRVDVTRFGDMVQSLGFVRPEIIIHLAAQSLVGLSVSDPVPTFSTNVMGTLNLLEAIRRIDSVKVVLVVTTDKVYGIQDSGSAFTERARLDGFADPYSASKACAEFVTASFHKTFFNDTMRSPRIATARAGNVIGGGDWSVDRLVPDYLRAVVSGETLFLRKSHAIRPWQHALEPLSGYLLLVEALGTSTQDLPSTWNFGPAEESMASVAQVVAILNRISGCEVECTEAGYNGQHDADRITLDSSQAHELLGWRPQWSLPEALGRTFEWWRAWQKGRDLAAITQEQISDYYSWNSS